MHASVIPLVALMSILFAQPADPPTHLATAVKRVTYTTGESPAPAPEKSDESGASGADPETVSTDEICDTIQEAAAANELPVEFFTRLIWQESRFNRHALSRAGAQGIAQFMPGTANWRGLANPFHPIKALHESASWLGELRKQYGNLGLAAAAYNAGPGRVQKWLDGRAGLPGETRAYVRIITGRTADEWAASEPPSWDGPGIPRSVPCARLVNLPPKPRPRPERSTAWAPWGVQLAGDWSERSALAAFDRLQKRFDVLRDRKPLVFRVKLGGRAARLMVRIGEPTREGAEKVCARLRAGGGDCVVLRNPSVSAMVN